MPPAALPSAARVLVVDDEENISYLVASALRLAGLEVRTAGTAMEALADAQRTCLKDADVTRPLGPLTAAERKAVREKVTAAATSCHVTLPTLPKTGAKASGGSGS